MKRFGLTIACLVTLVVPVSAQHEIKVRVHEVRLSALRLPAVESGSIAFKACDACGYTTRRVTPGTRWEINGQTVRFDEFRAALAAIQNREEQPVTVHHDLGTGLIKEVAVTVYRERI